MLDPVKNFAKAILTTGYASGITSIVVSSGEGAEFPLPSTDGAFNLVWWNSTDYGDPADDPFKEIVRCTARSTDTFTITRAQEGTSDNDHNIADKDYRIALPYTKKEHDEISIQYATETVYTDHTVSSYGNILVDSSGGDVIITLPDPTDIAGRIYTIKKIAGTSSTSVFIETNGSETIDGESNVEIKRIYTAIKLVTDGINFYII